MTGEAESVLPTRRREAGIVPRQRTRIVDRAFFLALTIKGIDGALELIGGLLLFVVPPSAITLVFRSLPTRAERRSARLRRDPHSGGRRAARRVGLGPRVRRPLSDRPRCHQASARRRVGPQDPAGVPGGDRLPRRVPSVRGVPFCPRPLDGPAPIRSTRRGYHDDGGQGVPRAPPRLVAPGTAIRLDLDL